METTFSKNIAQIIGRYRYRFLKATFTVLISNCLLIVNPLVLRHALSIFDSESGVSRGHSIFTWITFLLGIAAVSAFFKYQMRLQFISISRDAERNLRSQLFDKIQTQSMAFFDRHGTGELLSRLTNDISAYRDVLGPGIMYPIFFLTLVVPGVTALFFISTPLAAMSLIPLFAIPLINLAIRRKTYQMSYMAQKGLAELSDTAQEQYTGIRIIKGYVAEQSCRNKFKDLSKQLIRNNFKLNCYQGFLLPLVTLLTKVTTVILVLAFGFMILKEGDTLSPADFISFMWIQSYIFFPILMLSWVLPIYEKGRSAYDRLVEIYHEPQDVKEESHSDLEIPDRADIVINHLDFSYPKEQRKVLEDFTLHILGGTFLGITGPVGSGKSTLFRLLAREYEVPKNTILIGGHDIHQYPLSAFRNSVVTVEQLPFLFSRSIADNVRFGNEHATIEEIEIVSKDVDLHETVLAFPEQYETVIGERGVTLSGGQKQRLAIARALLVNRSILLLDDIFSAVDSKTQRRILSAMQKNFKGKTVLLITHRAAVLEAMDRVVYLKDGKVVEDGSPKTLNKLNGHYAALIALQKEQFFSNGAYEK